MGLRQDATSLLGWHPGDAQIGKAGGPKGDAAGRILCRFPTSTSGDVLVVLFRLRGYHRHLARGHLRDPRRYPIPVE